MYNKNPGFRIYHLGRRGFLDLSVVAPVRLLGLVASGGDADLAPKLHPELLQVRLGLPVLSLRPSSAKREASAHWDTTPAQNCESIIYQEPHTFEY